MDTTSPVSGGPSRPEPDLRAAEGGSARVHPLERALTAVVAAHLCFLAWAYGGVDAWSQCVSAGLSAAELALALWPRGGGRGAGWARLRGLPVFWAWLALLGYVAVQGLNPAFEYQAEGVRWWLVERAHVAWLPQGMSVPFGEPGPWLAWVNWASAGGTVCALWAGLTRRRCGRWLLAALAANAFAFAVFGIVQHAAGARLIFWHRAVEYPYFFASIFYKNHAAAYLGLAGCVALGVALRMAHEGRRERSHPGVLFLLFAVVIASGLVMTGSASGTGLYGAALAAGGGAGWWRQVRGAGRVGRWAALVVAVPLAVAAGAGAYAGREEALMSGRRAFSGDGRHSVAMRVMAVRRGWEMAGDARAAGWGAGCFQYGFTKYQRRDEALTAWRGNGLRWEHVHCDWLELLIELGVAGVLPVALAGGWGVWRAVRAGVWRRPEGPPVLCGLAALGAQACVDFPLHNPAVAITAAAVGAVVLGAEREKG